VFERSNRRRILLATTSAATMMVASSSAWAACTISVTGASGPVTNPSGNTTDCIEINTGAVVTGNVSNAGTLTGAGGARILVDPGATVNGAIVNTGTLSGTTLGIADTGLITGGINNAGGQITTTGNNILVQGVNAQTFLGGITNSGTLTSSGQDGILASSTIFTGGISNAGSITGAANGIEFAFTTTPTTVAPGSTTPNTFTGGIVNTGSVTGNGASTITGNAIRLTGGIFAAAGFNTAEGTFSGGIANSGTLTGNTNAVYIASFRSFSGDIVNSVGGKIIANGGDGILVDHTLDANDNIGITNFSGGVTNAGSITASANGINLNGISTFSGSVVNSGTITANSGQGINLVGVGYAGVVSNSGTITAGVNGIFINNGVLTENAVINSGTITATGLNGIFIQGTTLLGGVTNNGTITAANDGISIAPTLSFGGGFTNTGSITGTNRGVELLGANRFSGTVTNSGTIAGNLFGLNIGFLDEINSFVGDINNSGTISGNNALVVAVQTSFLGGAPGATTGVINNTGNITGTASSIALGASPNAVTINQMAGTITGAIQLSQFADIVNITGGTVAGNIAGTGAALATVNFAPTSGSFTYANTISNVAAVNVNSGTLFLQGTLSPTALTIATGATLNVQNGGSITPNITDNGTFAVQRLTAFTYGGVISGTGVVQQLGPGTTTLTGTNLYSGGTQINGGILAVASDVNLGNAAGGLSFNGGTLQMGAGFTSSRTITLNAGGGTFDTIGNIDTLNGPIGGVGGMTVTGDGDLIIGGAGTYSGPTNINAGTALSAGAANVFSASSAYTVATGAVLNLNSFNQTIGSLAGPGNVALGSAVLTAGADGTSSNYSGAIGGSGGVTKVGTGNWTLSGTNAYTGATNVNGGTLSVNGSIATSIALNVNNGGTVGGTGILPTTNINAGGTLSPGNSPGTITIAGNLTFSTAATYLVQVSGATADRTNVTGTAALAGTLQVAYLTSPIFGQIYTILHADGGRSGTFSTVTSNSPVTTTVTYTPTDVLLSAQSNLSGGGGLGGVNLNQNQHNVAVALDNAFNSGGNVGAFAPLFTLAPGALPGALTQLSGEIGTSAATASVQDMGQFLELMLDPFQENRVGGNAAGYGGPALSFAPERAAAGWPDAASAYARMPTKALPMAPTFDTRWTAWGGAYGASGTFNGNAVIGSNNLTARSGGIAAGLDYRFSPDTVIGIAAAGSALSYGLNNGLGSGTGDSFKFGVYGSTHRDNAYVSASAAYGHYSITTDRSVALPGVVLDHLKGNFDANSFGGRIEGGYRFPVAANWGVTPYAAVQAQVFQQPGYVETDLTGLSAFALNYASHSFNEERSELGLRFDSRIPTTDSSTLLWRGRVAWAHEFDTNPAVTAGFVTLPGASFLVTGASLPRDAALVSVGPELRLRNGWTLRAKFDGSFAPQSQTYAGTGTVSYTW
jgi:autotransporter-associated beta strand protein